MIRAIKKCAVFVSLLAALLVSQVCADALQKPELIVATAANYPPIVFEQDGELRGLEVDLLKGVEAQLGQRLVLKTMAWDALLPALEAGQVDMAMSGLTVTDERRQRVAFTEPYLVLAQMAIIRVADAARPGAPRALMTPGIRLGYERDSTGEAYVMTLNGGRDAVAYADAEAGLRALMAGAIDGFIHDAPTSWYIATRPEYRSLMSLYRPLTSEPIALAVARDQPALLQRLNAVLETLREEGYVERITNRWMPVRVTVEGGP